MLFLFGLLFYSAAVAAQEPTNPLCSWACDNPTCEQICEAECDAPVCSLDCTSGSPELCNPPVCSIQCPNEAEQIKTEACPMCETVCQPPVCATGTECTVLCEAVNCSWKCRQPPFCQRPHCELQCAAPACEYVPSAASTTSNSGIGVASFIFIYSILM
jgi:hypothetical protein